MNLLLDSALKASLILGVALGATVFLRERSAALRHWVLSVAVGCALAAPLLAFVVPSWQIDAGALLPQPSAESTRVATPSETAAPGDSVAVQSEHSATTPPDTSAAQRSVEVARLAGVIWLTDSALSLLVLGTGMARLARVASASSRIDVGRAAAMTEEISAHLGLSRPVTLLQTEHPNLLVTWGLLRPRVLLPVSWHGWAEDRVRVVICHELAHIQRGDWAVQIAAEVLRAVYSKRCHRQVRVRRSASRPVHARSQPARIRRVQGGRQNRWEPAPEPRSPGWLAAGDHHCNRRQGGSAAIQ